MKRFAFALVCLFIGVSSVAQADLSSQDWREMGDELRFSQQKLSGEWTESQKWQAWLCDGFYSYHLALQGLIQKVDLELQDEGFVVATANIEGIFAKVRGEYKSKATLCLPAGGWLGVGTRSAQLKTEIHFGDSGEVKDIRLKILSTRFDRLEMGRLFPTWFEDFFTGVLNTKLGNWISDKVTEVVRKNLPQDR